MREKAQPVRYQEVAKGAIGIFLPLFALMIIVVALIYFIQTGSSRVALEYREMQNVELRRKYVLGDIESATTDLLFLARLIEQEKPFQRQGLLDPDERASLSRELFLFAETKKLYDQVRLLDEKGMEMVRVNFNTGLPAVVLELELRNKQGRYYFDDTFRLGKGEVYVSPFDLNCRYYWLRCRAVSRNGTYRPLS